MKKWRRYERRNFFLIVGINHIKANIHQISSNRYDWDVVINWLTKRSFVSQSHHRIARYHHIANTTQFHCKKNNIAKCITSNIPVGLARIDAAKKNHDNIA